MKVRLWTTTVDDGTEVVTMVYPTEMPAFEALKTNFTNPEAGDPDFDITNIDGRADMISWMTERAGLLVYIDEHEIEVPCES